MICPGVAAGLHLKLKGDVGGLALGPKPVYSSARLIRDAEVRAPTELEKDDGPRGLIPRFGWRSGFAENAAAHKLGMEFDGQAPGFDRRLLIQLRL